MGVKTNRVFKHKTQGFNKVVAFSFNLSVKYKWSLLWKCDMFIYISIKTGKRFLPIQNVKIKYINKTKNTCY